MSKPKPRIPGTSQTMFVLPEIPDSADPEFKNALAIRNTASVTGECPSCGAHFSRLEQDEHGIWHLTMEHEDECEGLLDP